MMPRRQTKASRAAMRRYHADMIFRIRRFDPQRDRRSYWQTYEVDIQGLQEFNWHYLRLSGTLVTFFVAIYLFGMHCLHAPSATGAAFVAGGGSSGVDGCSMATAAACALDRAAGLGG